MTSSMNLRFCRSRATRAPHDYVSLSQRVVAVLEQGARARQESNFWTTTILAGLVAFTALGTSQAQTDPGPRGGPAGAGGPITGLTYAETTFYYAGKERFQEVDSVSGTEPGATGVGLGPRFNMNSCAGCHAQPAAGGSSPSPYSQQNPAYNPEVAVAKGFGARNRIPWFVTADGSVREVRFKANPDGTPDGGVHALYVITGRQDAKTCNIRQPDFSDTANISFRIPTPVFGAGLIEAIEDATILAFKKFALEQKSALGIAGHENRNANDGTVTRFGWKAQNKSLSLFAAEAYNVEMGVTNEVFPNERDETPGCVLNATPEDYVNFKAATGIATMSDVSSFTNFMRFLDSPIPQSQGALAARGEALFVDIGCSLCHNPVYVTGTSSSSALAGKPAALFSDLLVHHMGTGLADGISQGSAGPDEFRTAPLWGVGQRFFFLHDGRTSDLGAAIQAHASPGSEANATIDVFNGSRPAFSGKMVTTTDRQDILNFLRSL